LDVLEATQQLALAENAGEHQTALLLTAALYHDTGMLIRYQDHESASADVARETLPGFGYTTGEIDEIIRLIMVTKLPQRPVSHDEEIICDADLYYLGGEDFFLGSFQLQYEWNINGIRKTNLREWLNIQLAFLSDHRYFTRSAFLSREERKKQHLFELKGLCENCT